MNPDGVVFEPTVWGLERLIRLVRTQHSMSTDLVSFELL